MNRPEQTLQRACVTWFRMQYPKGLIHHSPNGGKRSKVEAGIFNGLGVMAGFPDLICLYMGKVVFIEMKADEGKLSLNQNAVIYALKMNGFEAHVCRTLDEFMAVIKNQFEI